MPKTPWFCRPRLWLSVATLAGSLVAGCSDPQLLIPPAADVDGRAEEIVSTNGELSYRLVGFKDADDFRTHLDQVLR